MIKPRQVTITSIVLLVLTAGAAPAYSQTYSVLHAFGGFPSDGREPVAPLIQDAAGNLYGTTFDAGKFGGGTIFKLDPSGKETLLRNFWAGTWGTNPVGGLIRDAKGNMYGTTEFGGDLACNPPQGCGTLFRIETTNHVTMLWRFTGYLDAYLEGSFPEGTPTLDGNGNVWVSTFGSASNEANLTRFSTSLPINVFETIIWGGLTGPRTVTPDALGSPWVSTFYAGNTACVSGCGSISSWNSSGLSLNFPGGAGGAHPTGSLVFDAAGNIYGTTSQGGSSACTGGCGLVFKYDSTTGVETVLYTFTGLADGAQPQAGVILDSQGNLYGTTAFGENTTTFGGGQGVVFKLDAEGNETVLHAFDGTDGSEPEAELLRDAAGNLYGTTAFGGSTACKNGCGVAFKITP